jgi:hypothetical protein
VVLGFGLEACGLVSLDGLAASDGGGPPLADTSAGEDAAVDAFVLPADGNSADADAGSISSDSASLDAGSASCDGGWILCGGACVDPTADPANCNGCGHVCSSGRCGASVTESLAAAPTSWKLNGSAFYNASAPSAELTPITNYVAGTFVYENPIVVDAFDVQFDFRLGLQGGTRSDGIGFMIEQSGATAVGATGAGLGMTGLTGFGVELDLYDNAVCGDTNGDHVGVDDLTLCDPGQGAPTSLFASGDLSAVVDLGDAHWHTAHVSLLQGAFSVTINGTQVASSIALPNLQVGAAYYFGFAGATGGLFQADGGPGGFRQEVRNVTITFPTPRCL